MTLKKIKTIQNIDCFDMKYSEENIFNILLRRALQVPSKEKYQKYCQKRLSNEYFKS